MFIFKRILSGNQEPIAPTTIGITHPKLAYFDNFLSEALTNWYFVTNVTFDDADNLSGDIYYVGCIVCSKLDIWSKAYRGNE